MKFKPILMILLTCILLTTPVWGVGIQASPADFKYQLNRGEHNTHTLTIWNTGNTPLKVEILPKQLHIWDNHLDYNDIGIATWIQLQKNNFTLQAYQQQTLTFKLTIPPSLDYNDALGALLIHASPQITNSNICMDLVIPLHIHVPGPIHESILLISHKLDKILFSGMKSDIQSEIKNNGTIQTNITSTTHIKGPTGQYTITNSGIIYPTEQNNITNTWKSHWWDIGFFETNTTLSYNNFGEDKKITYTEEITIIPLWILIIILGLILTLLYYKKRI